MCWTAFAKSGSLPTRPNTILRSVEGIRSFLPPPWPYTNKPPTIALEQGLASAKHGTMHGMTDCQHAIILLLAILAIELGLPGTAEIYKVNLDETLNDALARQIDVSRRSHSPARIMNTAIQYLVECFADG